MILPIERRKMKSSMASLNLWFYEEVVASRHNAELELRVPWIRVIRGSKRSSLVFLLS